MKQKLKLFNLCVKSMVIAVLALPFLQLNIAQASHDSVSFSGTSYGFSSGGGTYYNDDNYAGPIGEDLDNDGDIDLVMPSPDTGEVSVLLNDGSGAYPTSDEYPTGNYTMVAIVGDYSGDGFADIAAMNQDDNNISVLINDGDGTFASSVEYLAGSGPSFVAQGNFNSDDDLDLAVFNGGSSNVSVLLNNGNGTFAVAVNYATTAAPYSGGLAEDYNNDGFDDLAAPSNGGAAMSVWLNNGDGTFGAVATYPVLNAPYTLISANLNGDNFLDLVMPQYSGDRVSVFLNDGDGTFAPAVNYTAGDGAETVAAADLDNDGDQDLVTSNYNAYTVGVLLNNGSGVFSAVVEYNVGAGPFGSITTGDMNNDGNTDIISANSDESTVSVLLNVGDGTFYPDQTFATNDAPFGIIVLEDLNDDGQLDLVVPSNGDPFLRVLLNTTPLPDVEFSTTVSSGSEATTNPTIAVELSAASDTDVSVDYAVTGGTATGGGTDYTLASGTLTIPNGDTTANIPLVIVNEGTVESDETVVITLSNPLSGLLGSNTTHTYTITNDDSSGGGGGGSSGGSSFTVKAHPNGTLILDGSTIYLIIDQKRYGFRDPEEYKSYGYKFSQAVTANSKDKSLPLAEGQNILKAMVGTLVLDTADNRTVYMVGENGIKRGFTLPSVYRGLGYEFVDLYRINMSDYPAGVPINSSSDAHPEGSLILDLTDKRTVWWVLGNTLHGFESEAVFNTYGFAFSRVVLANTSDSVLSKGSLVKFRDGTLVIDNGVYYLISDGKKLPFSDSESLMDWGYSLSYVINADLSAYTIGSTLN